MGWFVLRYYGISLSHSLFVRVYLFLFVLLMFLFYLFAFGCFALLCLFVLLCVFFFCIITARYTTMEN